MNPGDIALAELQQADGRLKARTVMVLTVMPPFSDYMVCALSSKLHHECAGFDEVVAVDHDDFVTSGLKVVLADPARHGCHDCGIGDSGAPWFDFGRSTAAIAEPPSPPNRSRRKLCWRRRKAVELSYRSTHRARVWSSEEKTMPEISRFLGIVVRMFYRDHAPPHFHCEQGVAPNA